MPVSSHGTNLYKKRNDTKKCDVIHISTDIIYTDIILFKFLTKFLQLLPSRVIVLFSPSSVADSAK